MQVQRGTGRVNALDVRDQQASAGHRHTLPEAGRDMLQMYPAEAQKRAQLGDAAQLAHRGPEGLRVDGGTHTCGVRAAIKSVAATLTRSGCSDAPAGRGTQARILTP